MVFEQSIGLIRSSLIILLVSDVCALRLDLLTFSTQRDTVATAAENNACADAFTITTISQGTSQQICGENAGQHSKHHKVK